MKKQDLVKLNNFTLPVIICKKDGTVISKNTSAKKFIPCPRCNINILNYMNHEYFDLIKDGRSKVACIKFRIEGNFSLAVGFTYHDFIAFLFSEVFYYECYSDYIDDVLNDFSAQRMSGILDYFVLNDIDKNNTAAVIKAEMAILDFAEKLSYKNKSKNKLKKNYAFSVTDAFAVVNNEIKSRGGNFAMRVLVDDMNLKKFKNCNANMKVFVPIYLNCLLFAMRVSSKGNCEVTFEKNEDKLCTLISSNVRGRDFSLSENNVVSWIKYCHPDEYLNLLPFLLLGEKSGVDIDVFVNEKGNLTLNISFDLVSDEVVVFTSTLCEVFRLQEYVEFLSSFMA